MNTNPYRIHIDEGYTLDFLIPGFFIGILGPITLLFDHLNQGIFEATFGEIGPWLKYGWITFTSVVFLALLMVKSGIELEIAAYRIRVYKSLLSLRVGRWEELKDAIQARLELTSESQTLMSRANEVTYRTKTFDLIIDLPKDQEVEIHAFTSRKLALATLKAIKKHWSIPILDATVRRG